jgi:UDPglucose 6-dehydrogenase
VAYTNELARICERIGADASEVERGLRSEPRIGRRAYVSPGPPLAGGRQLAAERGLQSPVVDAVRTSNQLHQAWAFERAMTLLDGARHPRATVLGLTYKPGTDTLRRSAAVDLARALLDQGVEIRAFDPAVRALPPELDRIRLADDADGALAGADVAIVATPWPQFRELTADQLIRAMAQPRLIDQAGFLPHLAGDPRLVYVRVGQPLPPVRTEA